MRHRRRTRRLGCQMAHRKALLRNMVTSLLEHGRIVTTVPRAKEVRRLADKMVTLAKDGSLHSRRQALSFVCSRAVVAKLFEHWREQFVERNGGYTRIVRVGPRRGDAAMLSVVEMAVDPLERLKSSRSPRRTRRGETPATQAGPQAAGSVAELPPFDDEAASSQAALEAGADVQDSKIKGEGEAVGEGIELTGEAVDTTKVGDPSFR